MPSHLDPFGYFPEMASVIRGLGPAPGSLAAIDGYAFHTPYVFAAEGERTLRLRFQGLAASAGRLRLELKRHADDGTPAEIVAVVEQPLEDLIRRGGRHSLRFEGELGRAFALHGHVLGWTDAAAAALSVKVDALQADRASLRRASRAIFTRAAPPRKRPAPTGSSADAGLVRDRAATLRTPTSQSCTAAQFDEPEFDAWVKALRVRKRRHRKLWEFVYILQVLRTRGMLQPGFKGLGFGVGEERLPSLFAAMGLDIEATDLPADRRAAELWALSGQHSDGVDQLHFSELCDRAALDRHVTYRPVDMNDIPADLRGFDFCWSACAFEHLGSIDAGLRFFRESLKCLRPGGVAVHTTELNLSSDDRTLANGPVVLFRRKDMERLASELRSEGHDVSPINYDLGGRPADRHIDAPPYSTDPHLKLLLQSFVSTSFGLVARRGPDRPPL